MRRLAVVLAVALLVLVVALRPAVAPARQVRLPSLVVAALAQPVPLARVAVQYLAVAVALYPPRAVAVYRLLPANPALVVARAADLAPALAAVAKVPPHLVPFPVLVVSLKVSYGLR